MFLLGLSLTCFSVPIAIHFFSLLNKVSRYPSTYRLANGWTEETVVTIAILAVLTAMIGAVLMFCAWVKRRNKEALLSIENQARPTFCPRCAVNVSSDNNICPICGNQLETR